VVPPAKAQAKDQRHLGSKYLLYPKWCTQRCWQSKTQIAAGPLVMGDLTRTCELAGSHAEGVPHINSEPMDPARGGIEVSQSSAVYVLALNAGSSSLKFCVFCRA